MNFREAADKLLMHLLDAVKTCQKVRFFYLIFEERSTQCKESDISFLGSLNVLFCLYKEESAAETIMWRILRSLLWVALQANNQKDYQQFWKKVVLSIILFSWENEYLCVRRERAFWVDRFVLPPTEDVPRREKVKVWGQICCRFSVCMMLNLWDIPVDWLLTMTSDYPLSAPALTCNLGIFHNNYH